MTEPHRFQLIRDVDVTGVSGTGVVADGVVWPDGSVSIRWRGDRPSVVHWGSLADAVAVHGHNGATAFVFASEAARLSRIAEAHSKEIREGGITSGDCVECGRTWPCPTYAWATSERDPVAAWDPRDDEPEADREAST